MQTAREASGFFLIKGLLDYAECNKTQCDEQQPPPPLFPPLTLPHLPSPSVRDEQ